MFDCGKTVLRPIAIIATVAILAPLNVAAQNARIAQPADESRRATLAGHTDARARPQNDQGPADPAMAMSYLTLTLQPSPQQQAALNRLLADQQNPSSPEYHHWLTPEQFADRFGVNPSDIAKLTAWLKSHGFTVIDVARARNAIHFSGTVRQVQGAFQTEIHRYRVDGEEHFANATNPSIPEAFRGVVSAIAGLNDFRLKPLLRKSPVNPAYNGSHGQHLLGPDDLAAIYDIAPLYAAGLNGTGQKIAIVGQSAITLDDIANFRTTFKLGVNAPQLVLVGKDPGFDPDSQIEADLDIEWAGAVARNATIVYIYAADVLAAAEAAVDRNLAPVISMSFGICEQMTSRGPAMQAVAQQANAQGITWLAASGDSGAAACDPQGLHPQATGGIGVSAPASIPEVTAVGGTMFDDGNGDYWNAANGSTGASAKGYIPEIGWNETNASGLLAGGGGASGLFAKPAWQAGAGVPNDDARHVPDVALTAALHDGYYVISAGHTYAAGGTSASTPSFAGVVALLNHSLGGSGLGNINPALYRLAATAKNVFHDITSGNNIVPCQQATPNCSTGSYGYVAGTGYDLVTGLGSMDVNSLVTQWNSAQLASHTVLTSSSTSVALNGTFQLTATVGPGTAPTGAVTFGSGGIALGSATLNAGVATITVYASQLGTISKSTDFPVWATYGGDNVYSGSSGSLTITVGLPQSGSAVVPSAVQNPVYADITGATWTARIQLTESAGVATTLTGFSVDGAPLSLNLFNGTQLAPHGVIKASVDFTTLIVPVTRTFTFMGADSGGLPWTQQLKVTFLSPMGGLHLSLGNSTVSEVWQNPAADPSCQWPQPLIVEELGGSAVQLVLMSVNGADQTSLIPQYFGTTHLAPYGALYGLICWTNVVAPDTRFIELVGMDDSGNAQPLIFGVTLMRPVSNPPSLSVSPASVPLTNAPGQVSINLPAGVQWTATISPASVASKWLSASPLSGAGSGTIKLSADASRLTHGAYGAMLIITANGSTPQYAAISVSLTVGASPAIAIAGVVNGASFAPGLAPGAIASVFGSGLASSAQLAGSTPLPLSMVGVSATVNNVAAPLYFVSSGQVNLQIPYETSAGPAVLGINNNGAVASAVINIAPNAPGIFSSLTAAKQGETIALFITGEGDVKPALLTGRSPDGFVPQPIAPVTATVGGKNAAITFVGIPPALVGTTQVNFTVPANVPAGVQPVVVTAGGVASPPVTLTVNPGP
jgi:uncharacterized protein (TIGR03437 family)